jgi:hypothetical protein
MPRKVLTAAAPDLHQGEPIQVEVMLPVRQRPGERTNAPNDGGLSTNTRPRVPRITRLMALAIKFQDMVDRGEIQDYADLARLGYVTRARITQIMNLLLLAPDIQECLLGQAELSTSALPERCLRSIAKHVFWRDQRAAWGDAKSE